jgi:RNA polymerase sigma-70 factor (ECF subfamily)
MEKTLQPSEDEKALIWKCQHGDREAFEQLYLRFHKGVYLYLLSMLRSQPAAEDLAQDVFVKLFTQLESYRYQSSFSHWLFRLARNAAIDHMRRNKVRRAASLDAEPEEGLPLQERLAGNGPLPSERLETSERDQKIRQAVESLPEDFRTALVMREWGDEPYEAIAAALEISEGTVKSRIFRARQMLAKKLKELAG